MPEPPPTMKGPRRPSEPFPHIVTNDGVRIAYEKQGSSGPTVVFIHGWSGSKHYFDLNTTALARSCQVYSMDLRFHGDSDRPSWGHHIARLAMDLRCFLEQLDLQEVTLVGASMGCAIIWSYFELFTGARVARAAFIDQAPLQNRAPDWELGSKGCYDAASLARLQSLLHLDYEQFVQGNAEACLSLPVRPEVLQVLADETRRCNAADLAALMADHTQLDWRPVLPRVAVPCLNCVGMHSGVFPPEGCQVVSKLLPNCRTVLFEDANHWLYIEEPARFNSVLLEFVSESWVKEG